MGAILPDFARFTAQIRRGASGIAVENFDGIKEGDVLEFFTKEKVIATSLT
ncbi:MAG TPA: hypothetical protein VJ600_03310 [Holophagaceae bacterium]|nr:hypothetical protein [Holophagaceae bacterium]